MLTGTVYIHINNTYQFTVTSLPNISAVIPSPRSRNKTVAAQLPRVSPPPLRLAQGRVSAHQHLLLFHPVSSPASFSQLENK